jgi:hypothetical protein
MNELTSSQPCVVDYTARRTPGLPRHTTVGVALVALALMVAGLVGGPPSLTAAAVLIGSVALFLATGARATSRAAGRVTATGTGLRVDVEGDTVFVSAADIAAAFVTGPDGVVLEERSGEVLTLRGIEEPSALLERLGFDADRRAVDVRLRGHLGGLFTAWATAVAVMLLAFGGPALGAPLASVLLALAVLVAGVAATRRYARRRMLVGLDGVRLVGAWRTTFLPYAALRQVTPEWVHLRAPERAQAKELEPANAFYLRRRSGDAILVPLAGHPADEVEALRRRIEAGIERSRAAPRAALDVLARGGRTVLDWRVDLERATRQSFRTAALPQDEIDAVLADPAAPAEARVGAALALRAMGDAQLRVRVAAESTASPRVRAALEAAAEDEIDDARIAAALDEPGVGERG